MLQKKKVQKIFIKKMKLFMEKGFKIEKEFNSSEYNEK